MKKKGLFIIIILCMVLIALLFKMYVQQMNTEVLDAFGTINERLEQNNASSQQKLDSLNSQLNYSQYANKSKTLDRLSKDLDHHIEYIKEHLIVTIEDPTDYSKMDTSVASDAFFFTEDGYLPEGQEFVAKIEVYKQGIKNLFEGDFPNIVEGMESKFNEREDMRDWLAYNFKGFPLVAVLTKLTQMQADIKQIKQDILVAILSEA